MIKYLLIIYFSLFFSNHLFARDINIQENIDLKFICDLEKKIIKNSEYNYQTFLAKDLDEKGLDKFEILSSKPKKLFVSGLSLFLSKSEALNVKIVNKDIVLFKAIDKKKKYSESAIIDRNSGELIHEITRNIKSENSEKEISFYSCLKKEKKV
ncbi:hypothetical protein N9T17_01040 [Candidatus Pelagibacter sp.]|nr:hypothetical protein [Candidatus Pelagibacter sp.]